MAHVKETAATQNRGKVFISGSRLSIFGSFGFPREAENSGFIYNLIIVKTQNFGSQTKPFGVPDCLHSPPVCKLSIRNR
jgi:hypothetical protein